MIYTIDIIYDFLETSFLRVGILIDTICAFVQPQLELHTLGLLLALFSSYAQWIYHFLHIDNV